MKTNELPRKQGLYDPQYEHDACGIGCVVNIKGVKSHEIVKQALTILKNLAHRGGYGSETNTGDGAGILTQIPHAFFKKVCLEISVNLPSPGEYGVGMLFLPADPKKQNFLKYRFEKIIKDEGQTLLGWRNVPMMTVPLVKRLKLLCLSSLKYLLDEVQLLSLSWTLKESFI